VSSIINGNTTAYKYGADGLRRQSTKNGVSTDYANDGTMLVREGHASGGSLTAATVTATYLIGARGPEYRRDDTQTEIDSQGRTVTKARWYVFDGLGSVVGEVDASGNLTSSPKYDVYGAVRANGGTATSKQGFVGGLGHVSDDTGLIYMRARYYDPSVGRFVSQDPARSGPNWFAYCENNPVNGVDRDGKKVYMLWADALMFVGTVLAVAAAWEFYDNAFEAATDTAALAAVAMGGSFLCADANQAQSWGPFIVGAVLAGYTKLIKLMGAGVGDGLRGASIAAAALIGLFVEGMMLVGALAAQDAEAEKDP